MAPAWDEASGGAGRDTFQFNALNEAGKVITDFQPGIGGDVLSMHNLLVPTGYAGADPKNDGEIRLIQHGAATEVQVDIHPGQHDYLTLGLC